MGDIYWSNNDGKDFVLISVENTMERINTTTSRVWRMSKGALMPDGSNVMYFWSSPSDRAPGYQQLLWTTKNGGLSYERRPLFPPNIDMILPHPKYPGVALMSQTTTIPGRNQLFKTLNGGIKIDPIFKPLILTSRVTWIPTRQHPHRFVAGALLGITSATSHYWNNKVLVTDDYFQSYRLYLDHVFDWQVLHYKDAENHNSKRHYEYSRVMVKRENAELSAESGTDISNKNLDAAHDLKDSSIDQKSTFTSDDQCEVDLSRRNEDFTSNADPDPYPMLWPENESETELRIVVGRYPVPNRAPKFEYARNPGAHWERDDSEFLPVEFALNGRIVEPSSGWRVYTMRKNSFHIVNWLFASSAIHRVTMEWASRYSRAMSAGEDVEMNAAAESKVTWPGAAKSYLLLPNHKPSTYIEFPLLSGVIVADQFHSDPNGKLNGAWFTKISTNFGKSWKKLISPDSNSTHPRHLVFTGITNAQPLVYSMPQNLGVIFATATTVPNDNNLPLNYSQGNRLPVSTYVSNDAGIHWKELGKGYHVPEFASNGAIWITAERNGNLVSHITVSADDSQTWVSFNFTQIPVRITNIRVAGDYNSRKVLIYAWRSWSDTHPVIFPAPTIVPYEAPTEIPASHPLAENGKELAFGVSSFADPETVSQRLNLEAFDEGPNEPQGVPVSNPPTTEPPTSPPYTFESLLLSLDLTNSFPDCTEIDYELWTPTDHDGREICLLGEKVKFKRRKAGHHCFPQGSASVNGGQVDWPVVSSREACSCTLEDYQCAPCFEFHAQTGRCRFICGLEDNQFLLTRYHTAPLYDVAICSGNPQGFYEWFGSKKIANVKNSESHCVGSTPPGLMDAIIPCSLAPRIHPPDTTPGPVKQNAPRIWFRFYSVAFGTLFFLGFSFLFIKNLHHIIRLLSRATNYFYPQYPNFEDYDFDDDDDDDDDDDEDDLDGEGSSDERDRNEIEMDNLALPETTTSSDEDEGALDREI